MRTYFFCTGVCACKEPEKVGSSVFKLLLEVGFPCNEVVEIDQFFLVSTHLRSAFCSVKWQWQGSESPG